MILSMTGYGRAEGEYEKHRITVELRAVNGRYLDCNIRTGRLYGFLEDAIKTRITAAVARGKMDCYVTVDSGNANASEISVNEAAVEQYLAVAAELAERYGVANDVSVSRLFSLPDILQAKASEIDSEALQAVVVGVADEALAQFNAMRQREGGALSADILARCQLIRTLTDEMVRLSPQTVQAYRAKIEERMREVLGDGQFDPQRVLAEAALFADRVAIDEEIVRLSSHLSQLESMLRQGGAVGRKLDFLIQEFNREANTVGSKCNDTTMATMVVDLKAEIEKIREQVQNIE